MERNVLFIVLFFTLSVSAQKNASVSFEKWISLKNIGGTIISPDGRTIVYNVSSTDWTNNSYDSELWMSRDGETPVQLTRTLKNSTTAARFTPDSKFVWQAAMFPHGGI
jgi:Tol biopolymer transport system component